MNLFGRKIFLLALSSLFSFLKKEKEKKKKKIKRQRISSLVDIELELALNWGADEENDNKLMSTGKNPALIINCSFDSRIEMFLIAATDARITCGWEDFNNFNKGTSPPFLTNWIW